MLNRWMISSVALVLAISTSIIQVNATQGSDWRFVTSAENSVGRYLIQVDVASLQNEKGLVRYWMRFLNLNEIDNAKTQEELQRIMSRPVRGPSLYQSNCATGQARIMQGQVLLGYEGPAVQMDRPANWEYVPPDSVLDTVHKFVCGDPRKAIESEPWPGEPEK